MMALNDIQHIIRYEIKHQSRQWMFRLFVLFSLVGIVVCHVFLQGRGNCVNWNMVALPCSFPLVNAYLSSVLPSFFIVIIVIDMVKRESLGGTIDAIYVHPVCNSVYLWGKVVGNVLLFTSVNVITILFSIFFVQLGSLAPLRLEYYLFYLLTLTFPSMVFLIGISLWLTRLLGSASLVLSLLVAWIVISIVWLPYRVHGILDFTGSGLPNLFSEVTGHVGLSGYLLHRLGYLLFGLGFIFMSVRKMGRIPNRSTRVYLYHGVGMLLVLAGVSCGMGLELGYLHVRRVREVYRESFKRHWKEETCRVRKHDITVRQERDKLFLESELTLYNPGGERLDSIVLFLNPGLEVTRLEVGSQVSNYYRDQQVLIVRHALQEKDSLRLRLTYAGKIDERVSLLHLSDTRYEDSFRGDHFFPTGRRTAFTEKEMLLLTPVCIWYPVAIPPENPIIPMHSGRDFTRFGLNVQSPCQESIFSQGVRSREGDTIVFKTSHCLRGLSLCGANYKERKFELGGVNLRLLSWGGFDSFLRGCSLIEPGLLKRNIEKDLFFEREIFEKIQRMTWYERKSKSMLFFETPVSFLVESRVGDLKGGQVEPGMMFLPERGFGFQDLELVRQSTSRDIEERIQAGKRIYWLLLTSGTTPYESHPLLGLGRMIDIDDRGSLYNNASLWNEGKTWIHSDKFPFMGTLLDQLKSSRDRFIRVRPLLAYQDNLFRDYLVGRSLQEILSNNMLDKNSLGGILFLKLQDLWYRMTLDIPFERWVSVWDDFDREHEGEVDYECFVSTMKDSLGIDLNEIILDWQSTRHEQFYVVKDLVTYWNRLTKKDCKVSGKIMNTGKTGGVISVEGSDMKRFRRYSCYLKPGEARSFEIMTDVPASGINTGLSSNRPAGFNLKHLPWEGEEEVVDYYCRWEEIDPSLFTPDSNEVVVDDLDPDFELIDGNRTWLQKWFYKLPGPRSVSGFEAPCWTPSVDYNFYGDSVRGCYFKSGGAGKSKATWNTTLREGGIYHVMTKIYRLNKLKMNDHYRPEGVVYYYTVACESWQKQVDVYFDEEDFGSGGDKWISLGEFELPAGKVSVTLSDKEIRQRKEVPIIADVVKWVKIEIKNH